MARLNHTDHTYFAVRVRDAKGREEEIECWQNPYEGNYVFFLPSYMEEKEYELCLNEGDTLKLETTLDKIQLNREYGFELKKRDGSLVTGSLTFLCSSGLPTLFIDTVSGNMDGIHADQSYREKGSYYLVDASGESSVSGKLEYITGRGNVTWEWGKKPYRIELDKKKELLDMGEGKSWILLANYLDGSYIRNKMVYDLADDIGLSYSPDSQFVDLYLNGTYAGLYQLTEKIEIGIERVEINDIKKQPDITGGYLLEWDITERAASESGYFITEQGQAVTIQEPGNATEKEKEYISGLVQEFENALYAEDGINPDTGKHFSEYIDLESWAKKYLIEEITKNFDAGITSQYFYKDSDSMGNSLLYAGPVWDYDWSLGNGDWSVRKPEGMLANQDMRIYDPEKGENVFRNRWFPQLYQQKEFLDEVEYQYETCVAPAVCLMIEQAIEEYRKQIEVSAAMDRCRWSGEPASIQKVYRETLEEQVDYVRDFLEDRMEFLDTVWIEKVDYCTVCFRTEYGSRNFFYSVERGKVLERIPGYEESFGGMVFAGWYYDEAYTQPFDIQKEFMEDTDVYAKWISEEFGGAEE